MSEVTEYGIVFSELEDVAIAQAEEQGRIPEGYITAEEAPWIVETEEIDGVDQVRVAVNEDYTVAVWQEATW